MSESRPVLVVVDVQNGFITEHSEPVVPVIVDLVRRRGQTSRTRASTRRSRAVG